MSSDRDPLDQLVDLVVFAPLGLALSARERLPDWVAKGRQELDARVPLARMVGQVALDRGAREARRRVEEVPARLVDVLTGLGVLPTDKAATSGSTDGGGDHDRPSGHRPNGGGPPGGAAPPPHEAETSDEVPGTAPVQRVPPAAAPAAPESSDLPIPGYDTLSASQVVQRLSGLSADELDTVRSYEVARRGRKVVLLKVDQLRTAS